MKFLVTKFEIFLSTSLTYNKVFHSAIMYVWYMTCEISTKLFFFLFLLCLLLYPQGLKIAYHVVFQNINLINNSHSLIFLY